VHDYDADDGVDKQEMLVGKWTSTYMAVIEVIKVSTVNAVGRKGRGISRGETGILDTLVMSRKRVNALQEGGEV